MNTAEFHDEVVFLKNVRIGSGDAIVMNDTSMVSSVDVILERNLNVMNGAFSVNNTDVRLSTDLNIFDEGHSNLLFGVGSNEGLHVNTKARFVGEEFSIGVDEQEGFAFKFKVDRETGIQMIDEFSIVNKNNTTDPVFEVKDELVSINSDFVVKNSTGDVVLSVVDDSLYINNLKMDGFQRDLNLFDKVYGNDDTGVVEFYEDVSVDSNLSVSASLMVKGETTFNSNVYVYPLDKDENDSWWRMFSKGSSDNNHEADLLFVSKNGACMKFHDNFDESILNFTGQHRCSMLTSTHSSSTDDLVGLIVVSTGKYMDLHESSRIRINEAIPIVETCSKMNDKSVFGVISGFEEEGLNREFSIGNMSFLLDKESTSRRIMVNGVGEGGIWVCNINGSFENGDLISAGLDGMGMRQPDDYMKNSTVAKITCDCAFEMNSVIYVCKEFLHKGVTYKKSFVGCVYYC
jgi:hypothetical protein